MKEQFVGKIYWITLVTVIIVEALSFVSLHTFWQGVILVFFVLFTFIIAIYKMEYGVYIAFAELVIGSFGRLLVGDISGFSITLRMGIFVAVLLAWFIRLVIKNEWHKLTFIRYPYLWGALGLFIIWGVLYGLTRHDTGLVFKDGNAYLYWLYLFPFATSIRDQIQRRSLLQVLYAGFSWLVIKTLMLLYIFTHFGSEIFRNTYIWIRDTRIGEITEVGDGFYRIFFQSYIYFVPVLFMFLALLYFGRSNKQNSKFLYGTIFLTITTLIISQSRSIWLGLIIAGLILIMILLMMKQRIISIVKNTGRLVFLTLLSVILIGFISMVPIPSGTGASGFGGLSDRAKSSNDEALISRWNLLDPLLTEIQKNPVLGQGFGAEVEFITEDPRLKETFPDGRVHTYAFEWGWLDMWVEMGLGFVIIMLTILYTLITESVTLMKGEKRWLGLSFILTIISLAVIHFFTPYLNHPLGIGMILFIYVFMEHQTIKERASSNISLRKKISTQPKVAPITSE